MAATGCSLILASNVGDTFLDAHTTDIMLVATDCVVTGAMLMGFATTTGSAPLPSSVRIDAFSLSTTGHLFAPSFSNVDGTTYSSVLRNAGSAAFGGEVVMENGIFGHGFSNLYDTTWASRMVMETAHVTGPLTAGQLYAPGFSNVAGVTYMSNLVGATLTDCRIPYSSLTGVPSNATAAATTVISVPDSQWHSSGCNTYLARNSNLGVGTSNPRCAVDVVGDVHASGAVYATSFVIVGGAGAGAGAGLTASTGTCTNTRPMQACGSNTYIVATSTSNLGIGHSNPAYPLDVSVVSNFSRDVYMCGHSNVGGVTYVSTLCGANLTGCSVPYSSLTGVPDHPPPQFQTNGCGTYLTGASNLGIGTSHPVCAVDVVGDVHTTGAVYASSFIIVGGVGGKGLGQGQGQGQGQGSSDVYLPGFSNVGGTTYVSILKGAFLSGCCVPYSCLTDAPSTPWQTCGSNVGLGTSNAACAVDVVGDVHATGAVYASSFVVVGGPGGSLAQSAYGPASATPAPAPAPAGPEPWHAHGANVLLGATSNVGIGTSNPACAVDVVGHVHATGTMYASAFVVLPSGVSPFVDLQLGLTPIPPTAPGQSQLVKGRNLVVNGGMRVDQRKLGAVTLCGAEGTYVVDRMAVDVVCGLGSVDVCVVPTGQAYLGVSLGRCLSLTVRTPSSIPNSRVALVHRMEGEVLLGLGWGTADASIVTVSFQCRLSIAGTYAVSLKNCDGTRCMSVPFTVPAGAWTNVSLQFPGDTNPGSAWYIGDQDMDGRGAGLGASLCVVLCGSEVQDAYTYAGAWTAASTVVSTPAQTTFASVAGAEMLITGLQLEVGTEATPYEVSRYAEELVACQRHLCVIHGGWQALMGVGKGAQSGTACVTLSVPQRAVPTLSLLGPAEGFGVYHLGCGLMTTICQAGVWELNRSTRDLAIDSTWAPYQNDGQLNAGMVVSMFLAPGTSLVLSSEL